MTLHLRAIDNSAAEYEMELTITNRLGLHARTSAQLAKLTQTYQSDILVEKNGQTADAKNVLSLLMLECPVGTKILVKAKGADADLALAAVAQLVNDKFGEE
ncbi:MAG: HPr family phosphocarrier protein [Deltaproteobacteria bacterium]|nr:HPr family phosphocarrier protein [Deltaproteobacteria bacterium]